jgi:hypothetical protein
MFKKMRDKQEKFDFLNFLYSAGAVIILIGVIAKLLEWDGQDFFMTLGLSTEAVVFGISSIKFNKKDKSLTIDEEQVVKEQRPVIEAAENESDNVVKHLLYNNIPSEIENLIFTPVGNTSTSSMLQMQPTNIENFSPDILWQLDEIGIINFPNDIFYQPEWLIFNDDEYNVIEKLFLDFFGKKLVPKKQIPILKSYNLRLPESGIGDLVIENARQINKDNLHILILAFSSFKFKGFFDLFMLYEERGLIYIRSAQKSEFQIFGGESSQTLHYCTMYHSSEMVISPDIDFLKPFIKYKNELLLDYIIKRLDINNHEAFDLMINVLFDKNDATKLYFIENLKQVEYNQENLYSFQFAKSIIYLLVSFNNKIKAKSILSKLLSFTSKGNKHFYLDEMINMNSTSIVITNSSSYELNELFNEEYLDNYSKVKLFIQDLINEKSIEANYINDLFEVSKIDTVNEIYKKYLHYLNKYKITQSSKQLDFALQCKNVLK